LRSSKSTRLAVSVGLERERKQNIGEGKNLAGHRKKKTRINESGREFWGRKRKKKKHTR